MVENPFETIGMDILFFKKVSKEGNRYVLVITDYYTKWAEAYPMKDMKAEIVARVLIRDMLTRHGAPEKIITDRGSQFTLVTLEIKHWLKLFY